MKSSIRFGRVAPWLGFSLLTGYLTPALGQTEAATSITKLTMVDVQQTGQPPTGPFAVVVEHDPGLSTHTIYRPLELTMDDHPVLVWGEGGCAKNGLMFPEYLSEIASHGFIVIADGPPIARPAGGAGAGGGGAPPGGGAGPPADRFTMVNGTALVAAMDWLEAENTSRHSRFYGKVNVERIAAMGMSCGGLMSYGASNDPRVAIPVFYGVHPAVGHGGTYNQDNGGPFGAVAVAWLKWQLQGDKSAAGRGYFTGDCGICKDAGWQVGARALP
jgi:hypothetical protein